jgi:hypothetical protein
MGRVVEVELEAQQPPRQRHHLPRRVHRRLLDHRLKVVRELADEVAVLGADEQDVAVVVVDLAEGGDQVAHIGADAEVLNLSGVDTDGVRQSSAPRARTTDHRGWAGETARPHSKPQVY